MDRFCFHCSKYYTDPCDPKTIVTPSSRPYPPLRIQIIEHGEALTITDARFFPEDDTHKLEFKFEDGDKKASSKMTVVVDGRKVIKEVELPENFAGNAGFIVNGREVEFEWEVSMFSAKFYFSYEGTCRIGFVGIQPVKIK